MFKMILVLPDNVEAEVRRRLEQIRNLHREQRDKDFAKLSSDPKTTRDAAYLFDRMVTERSKRITFQNVIKSLVNLGLQSQENRSLLEDMAETGLPMGRPVIKASKRGKLRVAGSKR